MLSSLAMNDKKTDRLERCMITCMLHAEAPVLALSHCLGRIFGIFSIA